MKKERDLGSGALIFSPEPKDLKELKMKRKIEYLEQKIQEHEKLLNYLLELLKNKKGDD